jgi:hypothetical protein
MSYIKKSIVLCQVEVITTNQEAQEEGVAIKATSLLTNQPIVENPIIKNLPMENLPNPNRKLRIKLRTEITV